MQSKDFDEEKGRKEEGVENDVKKTRGKGLKESEGGAMRMMDIRCKSLMKEKDFEATS